MKLVKLSIRNYAGIASWEVEFNDKTILQAENGSGKSTAFNAYKFSLGMNIGEYTPCLKPNNLRIGTSDKPCNSEVCAWIEKDGLTYALKRVSVQKWKQNKDTGIVEFIGNESKWYFDSESDCNASIYKEKVSSLFGCSFEDLELVTDITAFNADTAKHGWSQRRKWLFSKLDIDGKVKGLADSYDLLAEYLKKGKDEIDIGKELSAQKTSIKKAQEDNLVLIEDKQRQLQLYSTINFAELKKQYEKLESEKDKLIVKSNKDNKNSLVAEYQDELNKAQASYQKERNLIYIKESKLESEKSDIQKRIDSLTFNIGKENREVMFSTTDIEQIEQEIAEWESRIFEDSNKICKTCGQQLKAEDIENVVRQFEQRRNAIIEELKDKIDNCHKTIRTAQDRIIIYADHIQGLQAQLKALESEFIDKSKVESLEKEIEKLSTEISNLKMAEVKETVADKIEALKSEMSAINKELGKQAILEDIKSAIEMLKASSLKLTAQEQMRLKKQQQLTDYVQKKVKLVNESVNSRFNGVEFNFFRYNTALAESPFESTCTVTMDGKNYSCLSYGEKAICDIRTMKGLQSILGVNIPIWIDNLESISTEIETEQQFIGLRVVCGKQLDGILRVDKFYTENDTVRRN